MFRAVQVRCKDLHRFLCTDKKYYFKKRKKNVSYTAKALEHFDDYYGAVFGKEWPSIRLALLCKPKKFALINNFSIKEDTEKVLLSLGADNIQTKFEHINISGPETPKSAESNLQPFAPIIPADNHDDIESRFSLESFIPVSKMKYQEEVISDAEYFTFYSSPESTVQFQKEHNFVFPKFWNIFSFPRGDITNFPEPVKDDIDLYSMKIIDGSTILPVLALNIHAGDDVADLCAGSGDKSLAILFSMCPKSLLLNDASQWKLNLLKKTVEDHVPDFFLKHVELDFKQMDVRSLQSTVAFDKILLDVPSIDDRNSVTEENDNFFSGNLIKKRNELPYYLRDMLVNALSMLKEGGSLVYCTSTLSPILNDGVLQEGLYDAMKQTKSTFVVSDLKDSVLPFSGYFKFDFSFRYGVLVLPFLPNNFGPTYISKITCVSK